MVPPRLKREDFPALSDAEWEVMKVMWESQRDALAARDVYSALPARVGWAYRTVKTLLSRLVQKGALNYEQVGNSYLYRTVFSRDEHTKRELEGFVERVFDGAPSPLLEKVIRESSLDSGEIERLQKALEEKAKNRPAEKSNIRRR